MDCDCEITDDTSPVIITKGADTTLTFVAKDDNGKPRDLTGASVYFVIKRHWKDTTPVVYYQNAAGGGSDAIILITTPQTVPNVGQVKVMIASVDSVQLDPDLLYVCNAWATLATSGLKVVVTPVRDLDVMPAAFAPP